MDGINILLEYLLVFKEIEQKNENSSNILKEIDKYITLLENAKLRTDKIKYIVDYDHIIKLTEKYDASNIKDELDLRIRNLYNLSADEDIKSNSEVPNYLKDMLNSATKGLDNILVDMMLNVNRYNIYFMNKKTKSYNVPITADIKFDELDVELKDILTYLEVKEENLEKGIISDLSKFSNLEKLKDMAIQIKTGTGVKRALFDRIQDKNILLSILLHSDMKTINTIESLLFSKGVKIFDINKIVESIPSIFMKNAMNSKCKFNILAHFNTFINNMNLIEKYDIDLRCMVNQPVFLINNFEKNLEHIERLNNIGVNVKNVLEHVGNILVIKPNIVFNNISILSSYGVKLTNDSNNNGYTLLGMEDLVMRLDYFIERDEWKKNDGKILDNIDLIRGLIIRDDYLKWKNNFKYDTLNTASFESEFTNEVNSEDKLKEVFEKKSDFKAIIELLDNTYWDKQEVYYSVGLNRVSRPRILRNLCNYKGKDDEILEKIFKYKSNINNSEEVIIAIKESLEMGDESVKLSKGL